MSASTFRQRLHDWDQPMVLYETLPPHSSAPREEVADVAQFVATLLADHPVAAINVPEVRNESRNGARVSTYMNKLDPRQYGMILRDACGQDLDIIVNHPTVYEPQDELIEWVQQSRDLFDINNLILVGGESSEVDYPGPGPVDAGHLVQKAFPDDPPLLGGITIPSRRREGARDEPQRLVQKGDAGVDFFTSQVIFEAEASKKLIKDYKRAAAEADHTPRPIFLSFAPITGRKDAQFLEWLGVEIPAATREWVLSPGGQPLERSVRVAEHALRDIIDYMHRRGHEVPIGINVEHIMRYNFEASEVLLDRLVSLLEWKEMEINWEPPEEEPVKGRAPSVGTI